LRNTPTIVRLLEERKPDAIAGLMFFVDIPKYLEPEILRLAIETQNHTLIKMYLSMYSIQNKNQAIALLSIANLGNITYYFIIRELNMFFEKDKNGRNS
jgi:hypothetical protein